MKRRIRREASSVIASDPAATVTVVPSQRILLQQQRRIQSSSSSLLKIKSSWWSACYGFITLLSVVQSRKILRDTHSLQSSSSLSSPLFKVKWWWLTCCCVIFSLATRIPTVCADRPSYRNVTLTSSGGDLSITIFLPSATSDDEFEDGTFYKSSRFDHSSMIGSIQRRQKKKTKSRSLRNDQEEEAILHDLYGDDLWRVPHDPTWPESGIGLASEFGVGDDGAVCYYRCGWHSINEVTNGVLGYVDARPGESFLKIGVGELIKGSCNECDPAGEYKFNSPYRFAKKPQWNITTPTNDTVMMEHEATLPSKQLGYRLQKQVTLDTQNILHVKTTLTNLGATQLKTAWYSHHFFSCDGRGIGPGYALEMDLHHPEGDSNLLYEEPATDWWSVPLANYATVQRQTTTTPNTTTTTTPTYYNNVQIELNKMVERGTRIKTEFRKDLSTKGSFTLHGCGTSIREDISEFYQYPFDPINMYGFNLYVEQGTLSPEPQLFITLKPYETKFWTQKLTFGDSKRKHGHDDDDLSSSSSTTSEEVVDMDEQQEQPMISAKTTSFAVMKQSLGKATESTSSSSTRDTPVTTTTTDSMQFTFKSLFASVMITTMFVLYQHWQRRRRHGEDIEVVEEETTSMLTTTDDNWGGTLVHDDGNDYGSCCATATTTTTKQRENQNNNVEQL